MTHSLLKSYQNLYQIPIDLLHVSGKAQRVLYWHGISTFGRCVWFYIQDAHDAFRHIARLKLIMYGEVAPKLKALGFWPYVLDADIWVEARQHYSPLYGMSLGRKFGYLGGSIDQLGLSEASQQLLEKMYHVHVMSCIGYMIRRLNRRNRTTEGPRLEKKDADRPEMLLMLEELEQKLREHGFWSYVEDNLADEMEDMPPFPSNAL